jgi:hypothetical protein
MVNEMTNEWNFDDDARLFEGRVDLGKNRLKIVTIKGILVNVCLVIILLSSKLEEGYFLLLKSLLDILFLLLKFVQTILFYQRLLERLFLFIVKYSLTDSKMK